MMTSSIYPLKDSTIKGKQAIQEYYGLVKRIAHHLIGRLPANIQLDDLMQAGMIGLLEAFKNFDENKGASFETFAGIRIRGAMLDEIRKGDWAPRSVHRNTRKIAEAIRQVENSTGRDAKDHEVAKVLEVSLEAYYKMLQDANGVRIFGFEEIGYQYEMLSANIPTPCEGAHQSDLREKIAHGIASLPEKEQLVIALYYDEGLNLKEVGKVLNVSESRVCQLHAQATLRLQARMKNLII